MKKILIASIFSGLFISFLFSQTGKQGMYIKRIEPNYYYQSSNDRYNNLNSKDDIEKLFFGDFNASVEFSFLPSNEGRRPPSGFRILKNSSNTSYMLEVKYISNVEEAYKEASKRHPSIGLSASEIYSLSDARRIQIRDQNRIAFAKQHEEMLILYKIESMTFPVSNQFAEKIHKKMVSFIDNFKVNSIPVLLLDGYNVVFRNVVGNEVWSLNIHMPQDDAQKWAVFCLQIITDAQANKLDVSKYILVLDTFKN